MTVSLIWAQARNGVIGADGTIPWRLPEEQQHFKRLTMGGTVVMGRATWESLPASVRPLPGRRNIVLTRDRAWQAPGAEAAPDLATALAADPDVWVIGGAEVYREALPYADRIVRTDVDLDVDGDAVAPALGPEWLVADRDPADGGWHTSSAGPRFRLLTYVRSDRVGG